MPNTILQRLLSVFIVSFCSFLAQTKAQNTYGFEWIKTDQPYLKIKLVKEGVYRINASDIPAWTGFNPQKFQLFKDGLEQPIFVSGEGDGVFGSGDFIEFYGAPNDGKLDTEMFRSAAEQAQVFKSLFSDTAVYFLTVLPNSSSVSPLRFLPYTDADYSNYTPEPQLEFVQEIVPQEDYYYGAFIPTEQKYYLSEYGAAEGMMSALIGQSQSKSYTFQTPNKAASSSAQVEIKIIGASDFFVPNPTLPNHHVRIYILPDGINPTLLVDSTFRGYGERLFKRTVNANLLGATTVFRVEVVNDIAVGSDFIGVSYIQLSYQANNQNLANQASFYLPKTLVAAKTLLQISNYTGASPVLYDVSLNRRVLPLKSGNQLQALLPYNAAKSKLILHESSQVFAPVSISAHQFVAPSEFANYQ
ncbi:MAG: hypothetical protein MH472_08050 [Bacteroidia bacterium]|nr:hypothetical protein [Bacteroidia bacterium]